MSLPEMTASRCSAMASRCHPSQRSEPGVVMRQDWTKNSCRDRSARALSRARSMRSCSGGQAWGEGGDQPFDFSASMNGTFEERTSVELNSPPLV